VTTASRAASRCRSSSARRFADSHGKAAHAAFLVAAGASHAAERTRGAGRSSPFAALLRGARFGDTAGVADVADDGAGGAREEAIMARGQLLSLLQRSARRARAARSDPDAAAPVDRIRRQLLIGSAAWSAASLVPAPAAWAASMARTSAAPRVIVIGGGLAGLCATDALARAGIEASLYEASPRLGGRCLSERSAFLDGQVAERGGELIDTGHKEIRALAAELGLELDDLTAAQAPDAEAVVRFADGVYPLADIDRDFATLLPALERDAKALGDELPTWRHHTPAQLAIDRMSATDWIATRVPGGASSRLGRLVGNAYVEELGGDLYETSAATVVALLRASPREHFSPYEESDQRYHIRGGNDGIVRALGERLRDRIATSAALVALAHRGDGRMRVTIARGQSLHDEIADRVILALPFTLLREVDTSGAGFSARKTKAIRELGMGRNCKLQLQFDTRAWQPLKATAETRVDDVFQTSWEVTRAQPGTPGIVNCFSGGSTATRAGEGEIDERAREALAMLDAALPGIGAHYNGRAIRNAWERYPWTRGSDALFKPGQYSTLNGALHTREGRVHFAGEHTSADWQGYMNGGVESGQRAAAEVAAALGVHRAKAA
jgi:monoamine oxidase